MRCWTQVGLDIHIAHFINLVRALRLDTSTTLDTEHIRRLIYVLPPNTRSLDILFAPSVS